MKLPRLPQYLVRPAAVAALLVAFPLTAADSASSTTPAATPTPTPVGTPGATPVPEALTKLPAALQAQHLATLKTKGDAEIARRLNNLNSVLTKISGLSTLSASDKSTLTTQVQNEISGLTALKAKLDADTTLAAARTDVQSIITEYRVYLLMLPKVHLVSAADRLAAANSALIAMEPKLQDAINTAKQQGKDVTAMQASLTDMQSKTTAATAALNGLSAKLLALTPGDYNANHSVLMQYRATLGTAEAAVKSARNDAASIIRGLGGNTKQLGAVGSSPAPSATASGVPPTASPATH